MTNFNCNNQNVNNLETVNELIITKVYFNIQHNWLELFVKQMWYPFSQETLTICILLLYVISYFDPFSYPCLMNSAQILFMAMLNLSSAELNLRPIALWMSVGPNKKTNSVP